MSKLTTHFGHIDTYVSYFNGAIFLLVFGYPLIIVFSVVYYKKKSQNLALSSSNFTDAYDIVQKVRYLKVLIDSFLANNKNSKNGKSDGTKKNEILLKGYIMIHEQTCTDDDCPLKIFMESSGQYMVQKNTLLHYMSIVFNESVKKFPTSKLITMTYVQYNYEKKYNLNTARVQLQKLEKSQNNLSEDFIIYTIKQTITSMNNNKLNRSLSNEDDNMKLEDTAELKFKRCNNL